MKNIFAVTLAAALAASAVAQTGPFDPGTLPPIIDLDKTVHFVSVDGAIGAPSFTWSETLQILSGGDQITEPFTIGGFNGVKVTASHLNVADSFYTAWAEEPVIDILMQVYGDAAVLTPEGGAKGYTFLTGTLATPENYLAWNPGGTLPVEARNSQWNWVLFRIDNGIRPDGARYVGSIPVNAAGAYQFGGVNGGTIRVEAVPNLIVRFVAFGQEGAFGEPEQINQFAEPPECEPEPETNLAFIDIDADTSQNMIVLEGHDHNFVSEDNVGPQEDQRRAVRPEGVYLNFGVTDNYLGLPCNEPRAVKICLEFYDDPMLAGTRFGPEAFATDDQGGIGFVPDATRHELQGTGQWVRRSWTVPAVNLHGVNAQPHTAGPRLHFTSPVFISSFSLAILRTGDHPLAGQDPLADCFADPNICTDLYGNFAEMDLHNNIFNGLMPGTSGGDQVMIDEEAGPANDRRWAIRPAFDDGPAGHAHNFMNFSIIDQALGPTSQPNAHLAICVTYYDDPALAGAQFRPEVYKSDRQGTIQFAFTSAAVAITVEGTDTWREAYWEIPDMNFEGVNQGPQAAARFVFSDKVFFTSVRYAVIRPCGPQEGVNLLEDCRPAEAPFMSVQLTPEGVQLRWPAAAQGFVLEQTHSLSPPIDWVPVQITPEPDGDDNTVTLSPETTTFFRLVQ